jgi:hypothetical protein
MKATLEFDLSEERDEYDVYMCAPAMDRALWSIITYFRQKVKYEDMPEEEKAIYQKIREDICDLMDEEGIEL